MGTIAAPQSAGGEGKLSLRVDKHIAAVVQSDLAGLSYTPHSRTSLHITAEQSGSHAHSDSVHCAGCVDWRWLQALQTAQRMGHVRAVKLEVGVANALMPARYERIDRLLAQLWGRRRVLLFGPDQVNLQLPRLHLAECAISGSWLQGVATALDAWCSAYMLLCPAGI